MAAPRAFHISRRWLPLAGVLLLALVVRLNFITDPAYRGDLRHFAYWVRVIEQRGVFDFYDPELRLGVWDRTYPPLSTLAFGGILHLNGWAPPTREALQYPNYIVLLKLLPVVSEIALIGAVYLWLLNRPVLRWLIPGLLAISPGLVATSAWWGQYDAPFTLFLVLALIALNRDHPIIAWLLFGVAVLLKQPAIVLGPLLLVVTFRRYGWRTTALSMGLCGVLCVAVVVPFALRSPLVEVLSPYLRAGDAYPNLTNNAYNTWYALASLHKGGEVLFEDPQYRDSIPVIAALSSAITYKHVGLFLFGLFTLLLMTVFWRQAGERREFVWAAALFFGFFMLPTQVHERYLYPAAVLTLIAVAQERRLLWVAVALIPTFSYNILAVLIPRSWAGTPLSPDRLALPVATLNIVLFFLLTRWTLWLDLRRAPVQVRETGRDTAHEVARDTTAAPAFNTLQDVG